MSLAVLRYLDESENEKAIEYETLMHDLTRSRLQQENPNDYCERDREFLRRLQILARADEGIISRVKYVREKLARSLPVLPHEWQEFILVLNCKGFYSSGVDISHVTFIGDVDLREAVIGGDFNTSYSTVTGNCNEQKIIVLGRTIEDGRKVKGEHLFGGQKLFEDDLEIKSIEPLSLPLHITYEESTEPPKEKISVDVDLSGIGPSNPPGKNTADPKFPTDPPITLRSQTPEQLEAWRKKQSGPLSKKRFYRKRGIDIKTVRIPKSPRVPSIPKGEILTEEDILSVRPPARKKVKRQESPAPSLGKGKLLPQKKKKLNPPPKPCRHSLRPRPAKPATGPQKPQIQQPATHNRKPRTVRSISMGQRVPVSLRTIDRSWDNEE
jgi:hypothetical protein